MLCGTLLGQAHSRYEKRPTTPAADTARDALCPGGIGLSLVEACEGGWAEAAEPINLTLREHQAGAKEWEHQQQTAALHQWAEQMVFGA